MKPSLAITLILVGGSLILAPLLADYLERGQTAAVLRSVPDRNTSVVLGPTMSSDYRTACWAVGTVMIATAVLLARRIGAES